MRFTRSTRLGAVALLCALCAPVSHAAPVSVTVTGKVSEVVSSVDFFTSLNPFLGLSVGDTITGSWSYDTSTPLMPVNRYATEFGYLMGGMRFVNDSGWSTETGSSYATFDQDGSASFIAAGQDGRHFPSVALSVFLNFPSDYFDSIPPSHFDSTALLFGSISGFAAAVPSQTIGFSADVTSVNAHVVPIPAAIWLFGAALVGLFGLRRKCAQHISATIWPDKPWKLERSSC